MYFRDEYTFSFYREKLIKELSRDENDEGCSLMDNWYRLPKFISIKSSRKDICIINDDLGFYFQNFSSFLKYIDTSSSIDFQGARLEMEEDRRVRLTGKMGSQVLSLGECLSLFDHVVEDFRENLAMLDQIVARKEYASFALGLDHLEYLRANFFRDYRDVIVKVYGGA